MFPTNYSVYLVWLQLFFTDFKGLKKSLNINNFKSSFSSSQWFYYSALRFHFLFSDCPQLITSIYILFMQSQGSNLEDVHLHGRSTFLHARYIFLDVLSPAWHIRRGGEDCHDRDSWKEGSPSPLNLPLPKDCTRTSELSIHVHATYKPMHVYVYFVGVLAHVWAHTFVYISMHSVYVYIQFVYGRIHVCIRWYTSGHEIIT